MKKTVGLLFAITLVLASCGGSDSQKAAEDMLKQAEKYFSEGRYNDNNYDSFWHSGGSVSFDNDWDCHISTGEWNINIDNLPEKFRKYAAEIDYTFNANVEHGCCGGCA